MVNHRQYVMAKKGKALRARFGAGGSEAQQMSYQQLCWDTLRRSTWCADEVLTVVSKMWGLRITCLYSATLSEVRYRHDNSLQDVDLVVVYNCRNHYLGAGEYLESRPDWGLARPKCSKTRRNLL